MSKGHGPSLWLTMRLWPTESTCLQPMNWSPMARIYPVLKHRPSSLIGRLQSLPRRLTLMPRFSWPRFRWIQILMVCWMAVTDPRLLIRTRLFKLVSQKERFFLVHRTNPSGVMTSSALFRIQILSKKVPTGCCWREQARATEAYLVSGQLIRMGVFSLRTNLFSTYGFPKNRRSIKAGKRSMEIGLKLMEKSPKDWRKISATHTLLRRMAMTPIRVRLSSL